jgi:chorismate mutase / prephenate dehydratase
MSSAPPDLKGLRRRLDEIDQRVQDLLIDRAEIVALVAASKKDADQPAFQPAREAEIIRRLVARHHGPFPAATLIRMWREMLAATVRLQSPFAVAVFTTGDQQGLWDLARDHYGSHTPMTTYDEVGEVIRAVADREASIGVLPMPRASEPDPWWPHLLSAAGDAPRVIARLPFGAQGNARDGGSGALTIGRSAPQESGLDRTLLAMECAADIGRARILNVLSAVGLVCTLFASCNEGGVVNLIEVEGFVPITDARLGGFHADLGAAVHRLLPIGGYAVPLAAAALTSKD